jgi:hypothetical protein
VRFLPSSQILTASGDGSLGLWDAERCTSVGTGQVDPAAAGQQQQEEEEQEEEDGGMAKAVPLALAVTRDGATAVTNVLGRGELRVFALPSLEVSQTLPTPGPALGVDISPEAGEGGTDVLFASVAAPEYLLVFQQQQKQGKQGGFELVADHPAAAAVRAFAAASGVGTEVVHAAEDEGLFGGMTKENLAVRHAWNDRKRKDGVKEKQRERGKRRRAAKSGGGVGGDGGGEGEEGSAGEEEGVEGEGVVAMEA